MRTPKTAGQDADRASTVPVVADKDDIARNVVKRTATGNVRLQLGAFVTKQDLDREYERVKSYKFQ